VKPFQTMITETPIPPSLRPSTGPENTRATALTSIVMVEKRPSETILGGIKMGNAFPPKLQGASYLCRTQIAQDFLTLLATGCGNRLPLQELLPECTYAALKQVAGMQAGPVKRNARDALGRWEKNDSDREFTVAAAR
jgi:hypothetical protein